MSDKCTDSAVGAYLYAYELNALPADKRRDFEQHLLTCQQCFNAVEEMARYTELLRDDPDVRYRIKTLLSGGGRIEPFSETLRRLFWPRRPLVFRPAVLLVVILLLAYPAYQGIRPRPDTGIVPLQAITLVPMRSQTPETFSLSSGWDGVIAFLSRGAVPGSARSGRPRG